MQIVKAIHDDLVKFAIHLSEDEAAPPVVEFATDVVSLWDTCERGADLPLRYDAFRRLLSSRWGQDVSKATAFFVLEKAAALVSELKKTHFLPGNSKS